MSWAPTTRRGWLLRPPPFATRQLEQKQRLTLSRKSWHGLRSWARRRIPVMLKITPEAVRANVERFTLEGRLARPYVAELGRVLEPSLSSRRTVALDLRGLTFVDAEGAALLKALAAGAVEIHGCSGYVSQLLGLP